MQLNGRPQTALLDTGCNQSLVQAQFVPRELWSVGETVPVICVHGHAEQAPTGEVYIETTGQVYLMKVGVAPKLPYPILLGTDLSILYDFIQESRKGFCGAVTHSKGKQEAVAPGPKALPPVVSVTQQPETEPPIVPETGPVTAPRWGG